MKLNVKKFLLYFALFNCILFLAGCTATWLSAVSALLPALETAVSAAISFVLALEGKTIPASVVAFIQNIGNDIAAQIANVKTLIADYQASASTGLLSQIQAVFQGISSNLSSILSGFNVTDSATVSKFTALVGLAIAAANAIFGLIPLVTAALASHASEETLKAEDKEASVHINNVHKGLQQAYVDIRNTPTGTAVVDTALSTLPTSLP